MSVRVGFCTSCQRDVSLSQNDSPFCPVCSSPLIERTTARMDLGAPLFLQSPSGGKRGTSDV